MHAEPAGRRRRDLRLTAPKRSCQTGSIRSVAPEKETQMKKSILAAVCALLLVVAGIAYAAQPAKNVNPKRHPHIAAAQRLTNQAFQKIVEAQQANEWDMGGHAQKAKELLDQANNELKQAAEVANANH
jgi:predicted lipoprotein with Yx(FWY)xxD motif